MSDALEFNARCPFGFEDLLADELRGWHIDRIRPLKGGVVFYGTIRDAYRVCLWSRVASRVFLVLDRFDAPDADALYRGARAMEWGNIIREGATIAVHARGGNDELRNTQFIALKVKDAICDALRDESGTRPDVDIKNPDASIRVHVRADRATVSLDLSGDSLHRRGYRADGVQTTAPMKEALAAAMLLRAGWGNLCRSDAMFVDPMCGSGTLVIEAAMIASGIAPGLLRDRWGFFGWVGHDDAVWTELIDEADAHADEARRSVPPQTDGPRYFACDIDADCIELARGNAKRAGVADIIEFRVMDVADLGDVVRDGAKRGLMAVNPPYGERLNGPAQLPAVYACLAKGIGSLPVGWELVVITPEGDLVDAACGLTPHDVFDVYNGGIEASLRLYRVESVHRRMLLVDVGTTGRTAKVAVLEKNTDQFAARLKKMARERRKWAKREEVSAYRVYDADLPDYAVAIDLYLGAGPCEGERYLVVQEYRAPSEIDPTRAARRLRDVLAVAPVIMGVDASHVFLKQRTKAKGGSQYASHDGDRSFTAFTREDGLLFELDFGGYLDTGLFLDHRDTRRMLRSMAEGKTFLNLFAYTGSATVAAAAGGAVETTTVDLSQTYLDRARRNMRTNGFEGPHHRFVRADAGAWITQERRSRRRYDLVFVDPPTFSNSKAMGKHTWSVQRDHVELLIGVSRLLTPGGVAVFGCNLRDFKPDTDALSHAGVELEDISADTIPVDFERNPKIHRCYLLRRAAHGDGDVPSGATV